MSAEQQSAVVTRALVAAAVGDAFDGRSVTREQLVQLATDAAASPTMVHCLRTLPAGRYTDLRQLWADLPPMPVR